MKFKFAFCAVAAFALASCSSEETIKVNEGNAISFKAFVNGQTRAIDINTANLNEFNATAITNEGVSYFDQVTFTKQADGTYQSGKKYYWPTVGSLDFYAYAPLQSDQVVYTDYKTFTVTPSTNLASQVDLVYANTDEKTKANSASGIALNFRHTGSKIAVKVKNTSDDLSVEITGWKVGFLSPTGTFTYADANTDGNNAGFLSFGQWSNLAAASYATQYVSNFVLNSPVAANSTAEYLPGDMILIPQELNPASAYDDNNKKPNGSFIGVKLVIKQNGITIASDENGGAIWAIWPIGKTTNKWEPGKKYTYIIDVADGGYFEDEEDPNDDDPLDPILDKFIKFVDVTVDDWNDNTDIPVPEQ